MKRTQNIFILQLIKEKNTTIRWKRLWITIALCLYLKNVAFFLQLNCNGIAAAVCLPVSPCVPVQSLSRLTRLVPAVFLAVIDTCGPAAILEGVGGAGARVQQHLLTATAAALHSSRVHTHRFTQNKVAYVYRMSNTLSDRKPRVAFWWCFYLFFTTFVRRRLPGVSVSLSPTPLLLLVSWASLTVHKLIC